MPINSEYERMHGNYRYGVKDNVRHGFESWSYDNRYMFQKERWILISFKSVSNQSQLDFFPSLEGFLAEHVKLAMLC